MDANTQRLSWEPVADLLVCCQEVVAEQLGLLRWQYATIKRGYGGKNLLGRIGKGMRGAFLLVHKNPTHALQHTYTHIIQRTSSISSPMRRRAMPRLRALERSSTDAGPLGFTGCALAVVGEGVGRVLTRYVSRFVLNRITKRGKLS